MPNIKLRNFKGLLTNIDESDADQEYLRECVDVKIRPGQISSETYDIVEFEELGRWKYVEDNEEILHFEVVYIDNDKNANKLVNGELISDYTRDLKSYYLLITYGTETKVKLFNSKQLVYASPSNGYPKFKNIKVINTDGTVKIIANDTIYLLSKVSRLRFPALDTKIRINISEISIDKMPTVIKTTGPHNLVSNDQIEIKGWAGTYGRIYGKSLNDIWTITVIDNYSFSVNNHITLTTELGYFDIIKTSSRVYSSGFIFEELLHDTSKASLGALSEIKPTGELQNIPITIKELGYVKFGKTFCDTFNFKFTKDDVNKTPINMSIFHLVQGKEEGFDSNSNNIIVQPSSSAVTTGEWLFPMSQDVAFNNKPALLLPLDFFEKYFDYPNHDADKDIRWKIFSNPKLFTNLETPLKYFQASGTYYLIDYTLFTDGTKWYSKEGQLVDTVGFERLSDKAEVVGTIINDYQDETVVYYQLLDIDIALAKYGIKVSSIDTSLLPKRTTAIAFYIRTKRTDDFQQIAYYDLCSGIAKNLIAYGSTLTVNGIYLNQTIGVMYDTNRYKLIRSIQDYKIVSGIPFIISDGNLVSGAIGSGNAMNIFYKQNIVPDVSDLNLTQLVDVNGTLGAADESSLHLISVTNTDGVLLYSKKDSLSYGISDSNHIVELPEGTVIYTKQGIFITNGYDKKLISEPINDIVEAGYDNGYVSYDTVNEELYFSNGKRLFKYCSLYNYWSEVGNVPNGIIRISDEGEMVFADDKKLYKFVVGAGKGRIQTMKMDLGDPSMVKSLRSIVFDFVGKIWLNGKTLESDTRSMIVKSYHVGTSNVIRIGINFEIMGTIYNISLNYDLQGEARLSKTYSNI